MNRMGMLLGSVVLLTGATSASAVIAVPGYVYNFSGVCAANDCSGSGTGQLTLNTNSTTVNASDFVSFTYSSNLVSFTILAGVNGASASGSFTTLPGADATLFSDNTYTFTSSASGGWSVGRTATITTGDDDRGPTHQWTSPLATGVPEPASWAMFIGGFGLVGGALRRHRVNVSYA